MAGTHDRCCGGEEANDDEAGERVCSPVVCIFNEVAEKQLVRRRSYPRRGEV